MRVTISPSCAAGVVQAPPSKSVAHRALLCGALSNGSTIRNLAWSKDIEATLACLTAMGAIVDRRPDTIRIGGLNPKINVGKTVLPCNESGSTLRFLLPLCLLCDSPVTLTGSRRLLQRPLSVYEDICRRQRLAFTPAYDSVTVCGRLSAGEYRVPGDVSSQFISGLLFALPLLEGDSTITVEGSFESASYVDLTLSVLRNFGIEVRQSDKTFFVRGGQQYSAADYVVEGDYSNAAFLDAFNLLGGRVKVNSLTDKTVQGDRVYRDFYHQLTQGVKQFDLSDCPDLAPVMFAVSAAHGGATFCGTARLRIKESDRSAAMAEELAKFGVSVTVEENTVTVHSGGLSAPREPLDGHNDHRIVMALSLLCTVTGGTILGCDAVAKSFPDFFDVLKSLQIGLSMYEA